jgi:hypothetical protein
MVETDGEGGWLTYNEAAELLGTTVEAVRRRARRYNWPRMRPNLPGEHARVRLPEMPTRARARPPKPDGQAAVPDEHSLMSDGQVPTGALGSAQVGDDRARVFEMAIAALREQLSTANRRIDELIEERRLDAEERRQMRTELADARAAERISAESAAALRHELDLLRARPWWRRWLR